MAKKFRKKRQLTPEQKAAAAERLAAARAKRLAANGGVLKSVHESVRKLDKDYELSADNVREWIKINKSKLPALKSMVKANEKRALANYEQCRQYIANMEYYLRTGIWKDMFYGPDQNFMIGWKVIKKGHGPKY